MLLESAVAGVFGVEAVGHAGDAVAGAEVGDVRADGGDGTSDVGAEDGGVGGDEDAVVLHFVVDGGDGDGVDFNEEFVGAGRVDGAVFDDEAGARGVQDGGFVGHVGGFGG